MGDGPPSAFPRASTSSAIVSTWRRLVPLAMTKASVMASASPTSRAHTSRPPLAEAASAARPTPCRISSSAASSGATKLRASAVAGGRESGRLKLEGSGLPAASSAASVQTPVAYDVDSFRRHQVVERPAVGSPLPQVGARDLEPRDGDPDRPPRLVDDWLLGPGATHHDQRGERFDLVGAPPGVQLGGDVVADPEKQRGARMLPGECGQRLGRHRLA